MGVDWGVLWVTVFVEALLYIWLRVEQAEDDREWKRGTAA